ncbi:unnamed protein product [Spirodela intermedia]|uniref:DNL-type domain-containing protein n=1 Tax=Spirodela intermedia TaxID=51605 RepID=A0A7I8J5X6_SPIIN|nr:unnamed protein product [Spirodela intermedia]CAA6665491.1 unnamed protein product [Spirodela intermedia]
MGSPSAQSLTLPSALCFPSKQSCRPIAACLKTTSSLGIPDEKGHSLGDSVPSPSSSSSSHAEAASDIRLPRRNLLVQFTCNLLAYDRGTVFLQCAGCKVYHKLVDNLNLVVEYDLRDDRDTSDDAGG